MAELSPFLFDCPKLRSIDLSKKEMINVCGGAWIGSGFVNGHKLISSQEISTGVDIHRKPGIGQQ